MSDWMNGLRETWSKADPSSVKGPAIDRIPDGPHTMHIIKVTLSSEKPMIQYRVKFPNHNGKVLTKTTFIGGRLEFVRKELAVLGIDNEDLDKALSLLPTVEGLLVDGAVRTKPGEKYSNLYFNRVIGREDVQDDGFTIPDFDPAMFEDSEEL